MVNIQKGNTIIFSALLLICMFFTFAKITLPFFDVYYYYFIIILLLPYFFIRYKILPRYVLLFFSALMVIGFYHVFLGNNTFGQFFKVWASTLFVWLFYFYVIKYYKYDIKSLFTLYLNGAFWVSILGFVQIFSYIIKFRYGYDYSWLGLEGVRSYYGISDGLFGLYPIHSIYGEPAHFGCGIAPAAFVSLYNIFNFESKLISYNKSIVIIIAMIFTTATSAYFALFIGIFILVLNSRRFLGFLLPVILSPFLFFYLYENNNKFQSRINAVLDLVQDESSFRVALMASTGSVRILVNNTFIAFRNLYDNMIFGTGLGSHATAYFKYSVIPSWHEDYGLNYNDANSLFNRMLSETGLFGILILIIFLFKFKFTTHSKNIDYWLINKASLLIICTYLIRQGHYFTYALPMFFLFYYYSHKLSKLENGI